ncbi:MAG: glycosyltransferase [Planctomycetota bacterium]
MSAALHAPHVSIVVIGRNEGANIGRAVRSARRELRATQLAGEILYVDSASTDDSALFALEAGAQVHRLGARPTTAARARNAGLRLARGRWVQFLDGDMQLRPGWLGFAIEAAEAHALDGLGGQIVERLEGATIWSRAFGHDWGAGGAKGGPIGGAGLWRRSSISLVGGFDESLEVGEDPDLCHRMTHAGFRIERAERPMVLHELGLRGPAGWWRRAVAVGRSAALVARQHGCRRLRWQRFGQPLAALAALVLAAPRGGPGLALLAAISFSLVLRRALLDYRAGLSAGDAALHAVHVYLVKLPQLIGGLQVVANPSKKP